MAVLSQTRFSGGDREAFIEVARRAKDIFGGAGLEFEVGQLYTGPHTGQWVALLRASDWESYGKAMNVLAADPSSRAMMGDLGKLTREPDRTFVVTIDI